MLLVVMSHVSGFELGMNRADDGVFSFGRLFAEFRMPLFFFVSGFVLYKDSQRWDLRESLAFLRKKSVVQLISPFVFLSVFVFIHMELMYSASLGVLIVAACLLVSSVLRLSPVMAHYLFGQKI